MNKRGYEFSFSWIFAIMIGAVVIFVAIYATAQLIETIRGGNQAQQGRQFATLLVPLETNLNIAKKATISVPVETRFENKCSTATTFGRQIISTYLRSGVGDEWSDENGVEIEFHNKYVFSSNLSHARNNFYVLSKPFKYPYKIADIMILYADTEKYCFVNAWSEVKEELGEDLNLTNLEFQSDVSACDSDAKSVCFRGGRCDIEVITTGISKQVRHNDVDTTVFYDESFDGTDKYALLYAAIFSDPMIYNCQVSRLMSRASRIATIYIQKSDYVTQKGCRSSPLLPQSLTAYQNQLEIAKNSNNFAQAFDTAKSLEDRNAALNCKLF